MRTSLHQLTRTGALTIAWLLVLPCLTLLLSAIVPIVPWVRLYAFEVVPNRAPWFLLFGLAALGVGMMAQSDRATRGTRGLIATAAVTALTASAVLAHFLYIAQSNGARINLIDTFSTRDFSDDAAPDESRVYSAPHGEPLWLDIYHPQRSALHQLSPVLVFVHGGGFVEGTRRLGAANLRSYADNGWTVVSIDYRLARPDRPTWDLATNDVRCALVWVAKNADNLGVDISRLALSGASAGGSLVIAAAYTTEPGTLDPKCGPRVPPIAAVIARAPLIDARAAWQHQGELSDLQRLYMTRYLGGSPDRYPERYAAVDMRQHIGRTNPPTLLLAGADDPLLPAAAVEDFAKRLQAAGSRFHLILFPYSGHDFNTTFDSVANQTVRQVISRFLAENGVGPDAESGLARANALANNGVRTSRTAGI